MILILPTAINKGSNRFYIGDSEEDVLAEIVYSYKDIDVISVDRTFVSESMRGKNVAALLLQKLVDWARDEHIKIIPVCSFAKKKMENNNNYSDVLFNGSSENQDDNI